MVRRTIMLTVLMGLLTVPGAAEAQRRGDGPGQRRAQALPGAEVVRQLRAALMHRNELGLTDEQVASLEEVRDRMRQELEDFRKELRARAGELEETLTEEQREQLRELAPRGGRRDGAARRPGRPR